MIQVARDARLPWLSLDSVSDDAFIPDYPFPTRDDVDRCMNCTKEICTNCLDPNAKNRRAGTRRGRPRKNAKQVEGQITVAAIAAMS